MLSGPLCQNNVAVLAKESLSPNSISPNAVQLSVLFFGVSVAMATSKPKYVLKSKEKSVVVDCEGGICE